MRDSAALALGAAAILTLTATAHAQPKPEVAARLAIDSTRPLRFTVTVENVGDHALRIHDGPGNQAPYLLRLTAKDRSEGCAALVRLDAKVAPYDLAPGAKRVVKLGCVVASSPMLAGGDYDATVDVNAMNAFVPVDQRGRGWWEGVARSPAVHVHADALPALDAPTSRPASTANAAGVTLIAGAFTAEIRVTHPGVQMPSPRPIAGQPPPLTGAAGISIAVTVQCGAKPVQLATWRGWLRDPKGNLVELPAAVIVAGGGAWDGALAAKQKVELVLSTQSKTALTEGDQLSYVFAVEDAAGNRAYVETAPGRVFHDQQHDVYLP